MRGNRRTFIASAAAAWMAGLTAGSVRAFTLPDPPKKAALNLSCQEEIAPGGSLAEKLDFMEKHGYTGLEVRGKGLTGRVAELQKALNGRSVKMSAICSGYEGILISEEEAVRRKAVESMKEILPAAGELGATGLIMVPAFNGQTKLCNKEARDILIGLLAELGDHAQKVKSRILMEPLNRKEAFFLRQLADAAAICRDVNNPGVCCMGDFWHMTWEETSDFGAIVSAAQYLHHMHMASRKNRKMPGEDPGDSYVDGFRGLKLIGYNDYVSLECGSIGDRAVTMPAAAKLLREQWEKA